MRFKFSLVSGLLAAAACFGAVGQASARDTDIKAAPVIYATAWGYTLAQDGSGFYNEVASAVMNREDGRSHYKLMPYKRAKAHFVAHEGSCLFPSSVDVLAAGGLAGDRSELVQSAALFNVSTHLFAPPGKTPPHSLADLKGKSIALPAGSMMMDLLKGSGAKLLGVNDEEGKAEMLMSGRVDMMSGMMPDTALVFAHMKRDLPAYDRNLSFLKVGLSVVCRKTPETEALVARLSSRIAELKDDQAYVGLLARAGLSLAGAGGEAFNALMPAGGGDRPIQVPSGRRFPHMKMR